MASAVTRGLLGCSPQQGLWAEPSLCPHSGVSVPGPCLQPSGSLLPPPGPGPGLSPGLGEQRTPQGELLSLTIKCSSERPYQPPCIQALGTGLMLALWVGGRPGEAPCPLPLVAELRHTPDPGVQLGTEEGAAAAPDEGGPEVPLLGSMSHPTLAAAAWHLALGPQVVTAANSWLEGWAPALLCATGGGRGSWLGP